MVLAGPMREVKETKAGGLGFGAQEKTLLGVFVGPRVHPLPRFHGCSFRLFAVTNLKTEILDGSFDHAHAVCSHAQALALSVRQTRIRFRVGRAAAETLSQPPCPRACMRVARGVGVGIGAGRARPQAAVRSLPHKLSTVKRLTGAVA